MYDQKRSASQPPVRLFASLDSPHQGAVLPRSVIAAVDFWGRERSNGSAKAFMDILSAPGASELLLYDVKNHEQSFPINTSSSRWLFSDYRQATDYKGFPVVLLSNGKLDGNPNPGSETAYQLNRWAEKGGQVWGRAVSEAFHSTTDEGVFSFNREYDENGLKKDIDKKRTRKGSTKLDLVQGSTYPFFATIYSSFESAFLSAIPDRKKHSGFTFYGKWSEHEKNMDNATFIPTTSSLDLQCSGDLSVRKECLYSQNSAGLNWENPGVQSTANAIYAVDPSHPGYCKTGSGRHVTGATATVDLWRFFCEVAKADWDASASRFRNPHLTGNYNPNASCMDQTAMSPWFTEVVAPKGFEQSILFPWARWTYNSNKVDKQFPVRFTLPAGWNTVATLDRGQSFNACDVIHITSNTESGFKGNWLHAELVLSKTKAGSGWWQLGEQSLAVNGSEQKVFWQLPCNSQALQGYRWAKVILNSQGGGVTVKDIHITNSTMGAEPPKALPNPWVFPVNKGYWNFGTWGAHDPDYADALGSGLKLVMPRKDDGAYFDANQYYDFKNYSALKVVYWPGTCQNTWLYFDKKTKRASLAGGVGEGGMLTKTISLSSIIDKQITPRNTLSGQRLYAQTTTASETCIIKEIKFQ